MAQAILAQAVLSEVLSEAVSCLNVVFHLVRNCEHLAMSESPESSDRSMIVNWEEEPDEWLWPAVVALEEAAERCHPPASASGIRFILSVTVMHVSAHSTGPKVSRQRDGESGAAKSQCISEQGGPGDDATRTKPPSILARQMSSAEHLRACTSADTLGANVGHLFLVAKSPNLRFSPRPVLDTRLGRWLKAKGWLIKITFLLTLSTVVLFAIKPGSRKVQVQDPGAPPDQTVMLSVKLPGVWGTLLNILVGFMTYAAIFHYYCRDLTAMVLVSFDVFAICISFIIARSAEIYEKCVLASVAGDLQIIDVVVLVSSMIFLSVPAILVWSTWDAVMWSTRSKATIMVLMELYLMIDYVRKARFENWSTKKVCHWSHCTTTKDVVLNNLWCAIVFIGKLCCNYCIGEHFTVIKTGYQEFKRRSSAEDYQCQASTTVDMEEIRDPLPQEVQSGTGFQPNVNMEVQSCSLGGTAVQTNVNSEAIHREYVTGKESSESRADDRRADNPEQHFEQRFSVAPTSFPCSL